ncbi:MAG TPA: HD domain-containing phosphohydrolase [Solirubrobacteraceae bacterium]|nr:HD domain-containing phosphohydrolase [Solirubrobacteraceae bacterium]
MLATTLDRRPRRTLAEADGPELDTASVSITAAALEAALHARWPSLDAGTSLVRKLALRVSRRLGLGEAEALMVDACAQLRDVGMIGLSDSVILNTGALSPDDWASMNRHPELGEELLQSLPGMAPVARLVRAHHERWDGEGYPDGLHGETIPLASRIVAVCDAFVAIATDRPHRRGAGAAGALESVVRERGSQFDPTVVDCLVLAITGKDHAPSGESEPPITRQAAVSRSPEGAGQLRAAITELDAIPVFGPACERALAATTFGSADAELVSAIESDIGLTVAVLRLAGRHSGAPATSVSAAVAGLGEARIGAVIAGLPRLTFPWQTGFEALLLQSRIHAQAVARAADRLAQLVRPFERDELVAAALVHDVGKLLLAKIWPGFGALTALHHTPEELLAHERRSLGYDHATLGGLLMQRWDLHERFMTAVSGHHSAQRAGEGAAFVRLADMVVHHAHGEAVDRDLMLRLAAACELSASSLRDVVVDLPHTGGSARRRAESSPLSSREREILQLVAEGKLAAEIADDLDVSESTVRSHLHKTYAKLEVPDRAQAVLKATEMSWI